MTTKDNRRKRMFANRLHRDIFVLVFWASLIPAVIASICIYLLIFNITASQFGLPEMIAYNIIPAAKKVTAILLLTAPLSILVILMISWRISHAIVGPFDRVIREMDELIEGRRHSPIIVRKSDKFWPLVSRINKLLVRFLGAKIS